MKGTKRQGLKNKAVTFYLSQSEIGVINNTAKLLDVSGSDALRRILREYSLAVLQKVSGEYLQDINDLEARYPHLADECQKMREEYDALKPDIDKLQEMYGND